MNKFAASTSRGLLALSFLMVVALSASYASAQQQVGYVLEINGKWFLDGNAQLAKGRVLPAGGTISAQSPTGDDYIVIVNLSGRRIIARRTCRDSDECNHPIKLPRTVASEPSTMNVFMSSLMNLLGGEPDRYAIGTKRGGDLPDAVVQLKDGALDLRPLFESKGKGTYYLRLRAIPREGKPSGGKWTGPLTLNWEQTKPATVSASGLQPGLYELALLDRDGDDYLPSGASAWVLAGKPEEYGKMAASFQEAVALTRMWGADVTAEGVRGFLRAQLDRLATKSPA
ncbi:MAG: hypothetical protein WCD76_21880 [Pyrinomonadaceae bacterium]